jgi:hypothetical protein
MTWNIPMMWIDRIHIGSAMVEEGKGHGVDFDESTTKIAFDFEINDQDSS